MEKTGGANLFNRQLVSTARSAIRSSSSPWPCAICELRAAHDLLMPEGKSVWSLVSTLDMIDSESEGEDAAAVRKACQSGRREHPRNCSSLVDVDDDALDSAAAELPLTALEWPRISPVAPSTRYDTSWSSVEVEVGGLALVTTRKMSLVIISQCTTGGHCARSGPRSPDPAA